MGFINKLRQEREARERLEREAAARFTQQSALAAQASARQRDEANRRAAEIIAKRRAVLASTPFPRLLEALARELHGRVDTPTEGVLRLTYNYGVPQYHSGDGLWSRTTPCSEITVIAEANGTIEVRGEGAWGSMKLNESQWISTEQAEKALERAWHRPLQSELSTFDYHPRPNETDNLR